MSDRPLAGRVSGPPVVTACVVITPGTDAIALNARLAELTPLVDAVLVAGIPDHGALPASARFVDAPADADLPTLRAALLRDVETAWVLWPDPEISYAGSRLGLICALAAARRPALTVVTDDAAGYEAAPVLLHRRDAGTWAGRVRPRLTGTDGSRVPAQPLPTIALSGSRTVALGDAERARRRDVALDLARRDVDDAVAAQQAGTPLPDALVSAALITLAACQNDAGRPAETEATVTTLAELFPGTDDTRHGLDLLARVLLLAGRDADALTVVDQLRAQGGVEPAYCDWLSAQSLAQLGQTARAWELARPLTAPRDTHGCVVDAGLLHETRALIAVAAGQLDAAVEDLLVAMAEHGQITGRGPLLREIWGMAGRTDDPLDELLVRAPRRAKALRRELGTPVAA